MGILRNFMSLFKKYASHIIYFLCCDLNPCVQYQNIIFFQNISQMFLILHMGFEAEIQENLHHSLPLSQLMQLKQGGVVLGRQGATCSCAGLCSWKKKLRGKDHHLLNPSPHQHSHYQRMKTSAGHLHPLKKGILAGLQASPGRARGIHEELSQLFPTAAFWYVLKQIKDSMKHDRLNVLALLDSVLRNQSEIAKL